MLYISIMYIGASQKMLTYTQSKLEQVEKEIKDIDFDKKEAIWQEKLSDEEDSICRLLKGIGRVKS